MDAPSRRWRGGRCQFEWRDGRLLHEVVPPSRWCVTRADLVDFRNDVSIALERRHITPTDDDDFDPSEKHIGPTMATINKQFIMPVSAAHGHASWALLLHPAGLECDLFVTHCWKEGVFEFLDKVLNSWPRRAEHAYCCMLSNPQTLDIGRLLTDPDRSPFARALQSAQCVLVVPNSDVSVYTRIWCVYEAYLSYAWDKPIFTATKPDPGFWRAVGSAAASCIAGGGAAWLALLYLVPLSLALNFIMLAWITVCGFLTVLMRPSRTSGIVNVLGAFACGIMTTYCLEVWRVHYTSNPMFKAIPAPAAAWMFLLTGGFFAAREADRWWDRVTRIEAGQLRRGYTGRLEDARSSVQADRQRILAEIQDTHQGAKVEEAISVLIRAGMSTPALRRAAAKGIDVSGAGRWSLAMVHGVCIVFVWHQLPHVLYDQSCGGYFRWVPVVMMLEGLLWAALFFRLTADQRGIAACAGIFFGALPYFTVWSVCIFASLVAGTVGQRTNCGPDVLGVFIFGPLALLVSWLGVDVLSVCPRVGQIVVRLFLRSSNGIGTKGGKCPEHAPSCQPSSCEDVESGTCSGSDTSPGSGLTVDRV